MTIFAITPNPSIDKCLVVRDFRLGSIHRPESVLNSAGGKGLNVARAIRLLGGSVQAGLILAGHHGRWMLDRLSEEGIPVSVTWSDGETRFSTSVVDPASRRLTEIYERGDPIGPETWQNFEQMLRDTLKGAAWATISGSLPSGAPVDGVARVVRIARKEGVPILVDTRDEFLCAALEAAPALVKINQAEARQATGAPVDTPQEAAEAAAALRKAGAQNVIITLGAQGAVGHWEKETWWGHMPPIQALAPVGSGDAFLGGLALSLANGEPFADALRTAIAAGAANALTYGAGRLDPADVRRHKKRVRLERLSV